MTKSLDVLPVTTVESAAPDSRARDVEIETPVCSRCKRPRPAFEMRPFGENSVCLSCYEATLELARQAMKAMPADEPARRCSTCRALYNPALGSAWCRAIELGDGRARICANYVPVRIEAARIRVSGGRTSVLDLWGVMAGHLRTSLGEANYQTWFGQVEAVGLDGDNLTLAVPDEYTRDWLDQRLHPVVRNALALAGHPDLVPIYTVEAACPERSDLQTDVRAAALFNPHYSFAEFIVGAGNRLAHASALACVEKPGRVYNPLVLYGGVGVGKTHLLQAIGQAVLDRGDGANVLYSTSETFTNQLIAAIRGGSTGEFRERYRGVDYLLLDDIQFIAGKEATQEEFFHTFNALHQAGKQIVVTIDRPPSELRTLEDRLRSRFAWGLAADVQPPDYETRVAILRSKAALQSEYLPDAVLNALAVRVRGNVRELEGALNRVLAQAHLRGVAPSVDILRSILGDSEDAPGRCTPSEVLQAVASYYRLKASGLASPQRDRPTAYARQMAMYLLREEVKLSLVDVGSHLGGRNHSTIIYGCEKIALQVKRKSHVREDLQAIKQMIYGTA